MRRPGERLDGCSVLVFGVIAGMIIAAATFLVCTPRGASADHRVLFPYPENNPAMQELAATGVHRWTYVQEGPASLYGAISAGLEEAAADLGFGLEEVTDGWRQIASSGAAFVYGNSRHGACGAWATECLPDFQTSRQATVYDAVRMVVWPLRSQIAVVLHGGGGHALGNFGEGYREAYVYGETSCAPLDLGGAPVTAWGVTVRGIHLGVMNCGLFNREYIDDWFRHAWVYAHGIEPPLVGWLDQHPDGTSFVAWAGHDPAYPEFALDPKAKYVAAIFSDPDGSWWSRPEFFVEDNGQPSQGMLVPALPGRCVWLKQAHNGVGYFFRYNLGFVGCF